MAKLEEVITQPVFQNNRHKVFSKILYTANYISDITGPFFKEHNILQQHYDILRIVREKNGEPISPGQIIEAMIDKGRDLTRLVDKLVKLGYLKRATSSTNRRKVEIFITDSGIELTEKINTKLVHFYDNMDLDEEAASQMNDFLDLIRQ